MICDAKDANFFFEIAFTYTFFFKGNVKEYYYNMIKNTILIMSIQANNNQTNCITYYIFLYIQLY